MPREPGRGSSLCGAHEDAVSRVPVEHHLSVPRALSDRWVVGRQVTTRGDGRVPDGVRLGRARTWESLCLLVALTGRRRITDGIWLRCANR